jgi:uncharacterized protein
MNEWLTKLYGTKKPVIAMAHIPALPGTPRYDAEKGVSYMVEHVQKDVDALLEGGVDSIMFCNEDDRPYVLQAGIEQIAAMARVVAETKPTKIPYGIDFLWDPMAAMALANATGASFVREIFTGVYESDMGIWAPDAGKVMRFRRQIDAENVRVFYNVVPESSSALGTRTMAERAHSVVVSCLPDVILVSGPMAGAEPDFTFIEQVKDAVGDVPVFLNTGARIENITRFLSVADGVIVGSSLKEDGYTWNPVELDRVQRFMEQVEKAR